MFGMFTIEKISSFLAGFTHIQNMTCSCQGNEITHEFVSSETFISILISVDMHNQYEWQHMLPEAVAIVCRCFETLSLICFAACSQVLILRLALKYFSAFSIKFNKTGFLSLTEAGLQEIGRCDQVSIFRNSFFREK